MKMRLAAASLLALLFCGTPLWASGVVHTPGEISSVVSAGSLVFPSGVTGTRADTLEQVDEVVQRMHERLAKQGLGIGNMLQHTIYLKDGAAPPIQVLQRFHAAATRLAPSLKIRRSTGTIIRVPAFADPRAKFGLDVVAGAPAVKGAPDAFKRIPFTFGPQEIVETITVDPLVFTAGTEAMDFEHRKLPSGIDAQIEAIVAKLDSGLRKAGLTVGNMIAHNLYVKKGTDTMHVLQKFHEVTHRYAPELVKQPSVGVIAVVDGMASDGFLLEMDAIAARPQEKGKPDRYVRVLFDRGPQEIARSIAIGDLVFLSGMEGVDFEKGTVSPDVFEQVDLAVRKIDATLRESGLTIANMIKHKLYITKDAGDPRAIAARFRETAAKLAPQFRDQPSAETLIVVEALAGPQMKFEASVIAAR